MYRLLHIRGYSTDEFNSELRDLEVTVEEAGDRIVEISHSVTMVVDEDPCFSALIRVEDA